MFGGGNKGSRGQKVGYIFIEACHIRASRATCSRKERVQSHQIFQLFRAKTTGSVRRFVFSTVFFSFFFQNKKRARLNLDSKKRTGQAKKSVIQPDHIIMVIDLMSLNFNVILTVGLFRFNQTVTDGLMSVP